MAAMSAARLNLRAPAGWTALAQARVEDALRTAAGDDGRLMVLRRVDLGRLPLHASPAQWTLHAEARIKALTAHAVHGGSPDAHLADAVWFSSAAEAQALLLAALAAGRTSNAWFWRLALPGWRGAALTRWLPLLIAEADRDTERQVELARAMVRIAAAGHLVALVAALPVAMHIASARDGGNPMQVDGSEARAAAAAASASLAARPSRLAIEAFERLPQPARRALSEWWRAFPADTPAAAWLSRTAVIAAAPELVRVTAVVDAAAAVLLDYARQSATARRPQGPAATPSAAARTIPSIAAAHPGLIEPGAPDARPGRPPPGEPERQTAPPVAEFAAVLEPDPGLEQRTAAAGLWLLIRPLHAMGLAEWLDAHPEQAAEGLVRALFAAIARRQRIADTDPLYAILGDPRGAPDVGAIDAWRVGLDRWLRRRTHRNLAHVVKRPGWLRPHEMGTAVRFRADQADIALRRRALDVDPGWVPWLGLTVRYYFRDEAMR